VGTVSTAGLVTSCPNEPYLSNPLS